MDYKKQLQVEKNARRDEVILIAVQLFLERGIEAVRMTDIAEACGLGVVSLYRYFGTKTALVIEVGIMLWKDVKLLFEETIEGFGEMTGIDQLKELFTVFLKLYQEHGGFLKFVHDFDAQVLSESVSKEELTGYEETVLSFRPLFQKSFDKGIADGTITKKLDYDTFYFTSTHLLLSSCQKFTVGAVLKNDSERDFSEELSMMIDMIINYLN